jgi:hypothetical protein
MTKDDDGTALPGMMCGVFFSSSYHLYSPFYIPCKAFRLIPFYCTPRYIIDEGWGRSLLFCTQSMITSLYFRSHSKPAGRTT